MSVLHKLRQKLIKKINHFLIFLIKTEKGHQPNNNNNNNKNNSNNSNNNKESKEGISQHQLNKTLKPITNAPKIFQFYQNASSPTNEINNPKTNLITTAEYTNQLQQGQLQSSNLNTPTVNNNSFNNNYLHHYHNPPPPHP